LEFYFANFIKIICYKAVQKKNEILFYKILFHKYKIIKGIVQYILPISIYNIYSLLNSIINKKKRKKKNCCNKFYNK